MGASGESNSLNTAVGAGTLKAITDGTNKIAEFQITVSGGVNTFYFEELTRSAPTNPKICSIFSCGKHNI